MFVKVSANLPDQCYDFVLNKLAAAKMDDADNYKLVTSCFFCVFKITWPLRDGSHCGFQCSFQCTQDSSSDYAYVSTITISLLERLLQKHLLRIMKTISTNIRFRRFIFAACCESWKLFPQISGLGDSFSQLLCVISWVACRLVWQVSAVVFAWARCVSMSVQTQHVPARMHGCEGRHVRVHDSRPEASADKVCSWEVVQRGQRRRRPREQHVSDPVHHAHGALRHQHVSLSTLIWLV